MANRGLGKDQSRKRNWRGKHHGSSKDKDTAPVLPSPLEGQQLSYDHPLSVTSSAASSVVNLPGSVIPFIRSNSGQSLSSLVPQKLVNPLSSRRWSTSSGSQQVLTEESGDLQSQLERTQSNTLLKPETGRPASGSFSKMSLSSMMGGLSSLSLSRSTGGDERGRSEKKEKDKYFNRSSSFSGTQDDRDSSAGRARSQSPFRIRRRRRDISPQIEALTQSDAESDVEGPRIRPRNAFSVASQSDDEDGADFSPDEDDESEEEEWSDGVDQFDSVTESNTTQNSLIPADSESMQDVPDADPLGEGVNVVVPPEPYFPTTLNSTGNRGPRRRKSLRPQEALKLETSRPIFERDRCTIILTHGDPNRILQETGRRPKRYVLASDLSSESRYALEWGIGTVLRDGDEMLVVNVIESDTKVDPIIPNAADRAAKLRCQQERQALAYILVRQVTGLLQRTRLNVTISCQAWHAKNSRHMLLDIVDYFEPTMLIVGSRGLGHLKGILLGSTSHYLIQKCSVPVMVARRRLKRPPRRSAHLDTHRARVSLAQAGIDRVAPKVDQDVAVMRDEIERDDETRTEGHVDVGEDPEGEMEGDLQLGQKVAGEPQHEL